MTIGTVARTISDLPGIQSGTRAGEPAFRSGSFKLRASRQNSQGRPEGIDMRVTRAVAGLAAVIAAVFGLSLATAGPAAAANGSWRAYGNTNPITSSTSTWRCTSTTPVAPDVLAQVCAVRAQSGSHVQAAVIVRNNRSILYGATAWADLYSSEIGTLGEWVCPSSGVGANSWSVCFGRTLPHSFPVRSKGSVNGIPLGVSPYVV